MIKYKKIIFKRLDPDLSQSIPSQSFATLVSQKLFWLVDREKRMGRKQS